MLPMLALLFSPATPLPMTTVLTVLLVLIILGLLAWAALYVLAYLVVGALVLIGVTLNIIFSAVTIRKEVDVTVRPDRSSFPPPDSGQHPHGMGAHRLN